MRWETETPTPEQLKRADSFFTRYPPQFLWSAAEFKRMDFGNVPEVAFLGRSNVGKSSLLNALLNNSKMASVSSKPGHTKLMNAFSINQGSVVLLDMPGYGHGSRPEWGIQILKYLSSRKQFRRAFILIEATHGPKPNDIQLLDLLGANGISYQLVLSKVDKTRDEPWQLETVFSVLHEMITDKKQRLGTSALGEIIGTAGDPPKKGAQRIGISDLRWAVMVAAGLDGLITLSGKPRR
ncbi:P-loop containing nucleoside triphosphate hydrolase protein [Kalaharituber pfeilii]|nr:P-loop containing nucleoside triphosphate hydrolase protein [Kalaharituber pfeilii]